MMASDTSSTVAGERTGSPDLQRDRVGKIELTGIEVVREEARHGSVRELLFLWIGTNTAISYAVFGALIVLIFHLTLAEGLIAAIGGSLISSAFAGLVCALGKNANKPAMALSEHTFGGIFNRLPSLVAYVNQLGWEVVLLATAVLGVEAAALALGDKSQTAVGVIALIVMLVAAISLALLGHATIIAFNKWITWILVALTIVYLIVAWKEVSVHADVVSSAMKGGGALGVVGGIILIMSSVGLSFVSTTPDYARYFKPTARTSTIVGVTTVGMGVPTAAITAFGVLTFATMGSISYVNNPIVQLLAPIPKWLQVVILIPFVLALLSSVVYNLYSSGLDLMVVGVPLPRTRTIIIDAAVLVGGSIFIVFFSKSYAGTVTGFLLMLAVPLCAWAGLVVGHQMIGRKLGWLRSPSASSSAERESRRPVHGWVAGAVYMVACAIGLGLVSSTSPAFNWVGYIGGRSSTVAGSDLGILIALGIGLLGGVSVAALAGSRVPREVVTAAPAVTLVDEGAGGWQ